MPLYRYVKQPANNHYFPSSEDKTQAVAWSTRLPFLNLIPFLLMAIGALLIIGIAAPIIYHELVTFPRLQRVSMISPLPTSVFQAQQLTQVAGATYPQPTNPPSQSTNNNSVDYTQAQNWFPTAPLSQPNLSKITHYSVNIPKLNIKSAVVEIGGNDLKSSLVQYAETANPGEFGSPVIFGHSILRQFYNPLQSNPKRYVSIFSTIMTLDKGDEILIRFDGIDYTYKVSDKYEVSPEQVEVLQQQYDTQSLKLITCTPEGTYLRRGVIEAQLI